jgi:hypothetical protein
VEGKGQKQSKQINPKDVSKSDFTTRTETVQSAVMQMGDCTGIDSMNWVVCLMFQEYLGHFLAVFFDDAHIYSWTRRAHLRHLRIVLTTLRHYTSFT